MKKNDCISSVVRLYSTLFLLRTKSTVCQERKLSLEILQALNDESSLSRVSILYSFKTIITLSLVTILKGYSISLEGRQGRGNGLRGFHDLVDTVSLFSSSTTPRPSSFCFDDTAFLTLPSCISPYRLCLSFFWNFPWVDINITTSKVPSNQWSVSTLKEFSLNIL